MVSDAARHSWRTLLDHLEGLGRHGGDILGPMHALQVGADFPRVQIAEMMQQHGAIGPLGHGEPGGQLPPTEAAAIAFLWARG
jgi:hypothetical protein